MPLSYRQRSSSSYDASSGLSWNETTVKASRPPLNFRDKRISSVRRSSNGVPSLVDIATRTFLRYSDHITADNLIGLPFEGVGKRLWMEVERLEFASPVLFYAFSRAFRNEDFPAYYRFAEMTPDKPLSDYSSLLHSPENHWEVALTISKLQLTRLDCLSLQLLNNIVALDIYNAPEDVGIVDDYLIRSWARQAQESTNGAWSRLRVLILRNQKHVTSSSLEQLSNFPSLRLFGVKGCTLTPKDEAKALALGWTTSDNLGVLGDVERDTSKSMTWDGAMKACVLYSAKLAGNDSLPLQEGRANGNDAQQDYPRPLLSYRLGPTSNDVLFINLFAPLVFFRAMEPTLIGPAKSSKPITLTNNPGLESSSTTAHISNLAPLSSPTPSLDTSRTDAPNSSKQLSGTSFTALLMQRSESVDSHDPGRNTTIELNSQAASNNKPTRRAIKQAAKRKLGDLLADFQVEEELSAKRRDSRSY